MRERNTLSGASKWSYQVCSEGLAPAVPEGIHKDLVVLDGDWAHGAAQVKGSPLEHDTVLVIDAGALGEDEQGGGVRRCHMRLHPLTHNLAVLDLQQHMLVMFVT